MGISCGMRSKEAFHWVRNLLKPKETTAAEKRSANYRSSSAFALFWNLCRSKLPEAIIDDITGYFGGIGVYMDPSGASQGEGKYMVGVDDIDVEFHGAPQPPPTGVVGGNYAR